MSTFVIRYDEDDSPFLTAHEPPLALMADLMKDMLASPQESAVQLSALEYLVEHGIDHHYRIDADEELEDYAVLSRRKVTNPVRVITRRRLLVEIPDENAALMFRLAHPDILIAMDTLDLEAERETAK